MDEELHYLPSICAEWMTPEMEKWCDDHEITTHCDHSVVSLEDDGNPLSEWFKERGFKFGTRIVDWVVVFGT